MTDFVRETRNASYTDKTRAFYKAFHQYMPPEGTKASLSEDVIPEDRLHLKMALIAEEFAELVDAVYGEDSGQEIRSAYKKAQKKDDFTRDIVEAADATADLRFVLDGFDIETAIPTEKVFEEVFQSNMTKLDSNGQPILSDGKTAPIGKILKSDNYIPPRVKDILNNN